MIPEITFPMTDGPPYLSRVIFSREGENVKLEIADERNVQKALCLMDVSVFIEAMAMLKCVKLIKV